MSKKKVILAKPVAGFAKGTTGTIKETTEKVYNSQGKLMKVDYMFYADAFSGFGIGVKEAEVTIVKKKK